MWVPALLVLLLVGFARAQGSSVCYTDPSNASCNSFILSSSAVWKDLNSTCAITGEASTETGWPSACSVRAACLADGTANCSPLSILLAACQQNSSLPNCSEYGLVLPLQEECANTLSMNEL